MLRFACLFAVMTALTIRSGESATIGYTFTITTAFHAGDPFGNRLDHAFVEPYGTGYFQVENTGLTTFTGTIGDLAVSAFAGDLSFTSDVVTLVPGQAVSVGIPDNSADVGGFNGPAYYFRPGVVIEIDGYVTNGQSDEPVDLMIADRDIASGVFLTDRWGLTSDSFVLQGGDPWGFADPTAWALALADGVAVIHEPVAEPGSLGAFSVGLCALSVWIGGRPPRAAVNSRRE